MKSFSDRALAGSIIAEERAPRVTLRIYRLAGRAFETFYMPSVLNPAKGMPNDSPDGLDKFSGVVEKKIRNLEKRRVSISHICPSVSLIGIVVPVNGLGSISDICPSLCWFDSVTSTYYMQPRES